MRTIPERTKKKKARVTLLGVIANGSTAEARKLLQNNGFPDARDYSDLEYKLTQLYKQTEDKIALEKDLANIHPHKEFITKYSVLKTTPLETNVLVEQPNPEKPIAQCPCGNPYCPSMYGGMCGSLRETLSNSNGCSNASGCGCSGVDGSSTSNSGSSDKTLFISTGIIGLFTIGIISIFALTLKKQ